MKYFILLFLYALTFFTSKASKIDNLEVSLLTVMPYGDRVYSIYGHTALRIYDPKNNVDFVFNWGIFDPDTHYFLYHFLKGENNYFLNTTSYYRFIQHYKSSKANVIEQILYFSPKGKKCLLKMLNANLRFENRAYRYNFLRDNCTTRIRDLIEKAILCEQSKVKDKSSGIFDGTCLATVRQLIHSCTHSYSWMTFGIDLSIGSKADKPLPRREALFLPVQLKEALDNFVYKSGNPLVISSRQILRFNYEKNICSSFWNSPMRVGWLIFCIYGIITIASIIGIYKYQRAKITFNILKIAKVYFVILFFLSAIAGCLITFFVLFSYHPCTSSNWNLFWLHPFHFVAFIGYFFRKSYWIIVYHWCNLILLFALLLGKSWLSQNLNPAITPYVFCLILASLFYLTCKDYSKWPRQSKIQTD